MPELSITSFIGDGVDCEVYFDFTPGCPEQGPTYDCGGQPAEDPEVIINAVMVGDIDVQQDLNQECLDRLDNACLQSQIDP